MTSPWNCPYYRRGRRQTAPTSAQIIPECRPCAVNFQRGWTVGHSVFPVQADGSSIRWRQRIKSDLSSLYHHRSRVIQRHVAQTHSKETTSVSPVKVHCAERLHDWFVPHSSSLGESHERFLLPRSVPHADMTLVCNEIVLIGGFPSDYSQNAAK